MKETKIYWITISTIILLLIVYQSILSAISFAFIIFLIQMLKKNLTELSQKHENRINDIVSNLNDVISHLRSIKSSSYEVNKLKTDFIKKNDELSKQIVAIKKELKNKLK